MWAWFVNIDVPYSHKEPGSNWISSDSEYSWRESVERHDDKALGHRQCG